MTYPNGNTTVYTYNLANKLVTLTNKKGTTELSKNTYTYSLDGNQISKTELGNKVIEYVYDGLGRLKSETEKVNGTLTTAKAYTYDDSNNRKTMTITGTGAATVSYSYDKNNRLLTETNSVTGATAYTYDNNGNQITKGSSTYRYDGFNQLVQANENGVTATYTYNGDGLRISKTVGTTTTTHIWDGDQMVLELNGSGAVAAKYVRGINLLYAEDGVGVKKYYLYNGHGDVTQLTDTVGNVVKSYEYDAFGNEKNPDVNDTNVFRYCGEYFDKETGTIYLRARYYDPKIGRFTQEDSYWGKDSDPLSLNLYTYCWNNPVKMIDPSGHVPAWLTRGVVSIEKWSPYYWLLVKATQNGWFKDTFWAAGFFRDNKGVYHARQNCLQRYGGYNDSYDEIFDHVTSMDKEKFKFNMKGKDYILWAWKGDYLNLGAGAEIGIYTNSVVNGKPTDHWIVDTSLAMPMTLTLNYKGKQIISYDPSKDKDNQYNKVWWLTGFNPDYQNAKASDLTASYTVTFNTQTMYTDFHNKFGDKNSDYYDSRWTGWNDKKFSATFNF